MASFFTKQLIQWTRTQNVREMPWKGEKDPYKIWISEVILQQTRVEQGRAYYERFISRFPDIQSLATADEVEVFKYWEGLGYYSRCRNLLFSARFISSECKGIFPKKYADIAALKGIGPYTAAAIASFAFGLPHAVVDGNVIRVLSRFFGLDIPVDLPSSKKIFLERAEELLDKKNPGEYNQAIMDFGATICKPRSPLCINCPLQLDCQAFLMGKVDQLPIKSKKLEKKNRFLHYIIFECDGQVFIRKRLGKDIWQNLFEFFLLETNQLLNVEELVIHPEIAVICNKRKYQVLAFSPSRRQILSHQRLEGKFFHIRLEGKPKLPNDFIAVPYANLKNYPFPRFIQSYMKEKEHL